MKSTPFLFLLLLLTLPAYSQIEKTTTVKSDIGMITAFLNGAEITRETSVDLIAGRNKIVFKNLSPKIQARSIRVSVDKDISVLSLSSKINYLDKNTEDNRIRSLKDTIELLKKEMSVFLDEKNAYEIEKEMILSNKSLAGDEAAVNVTDLIAASDFFRSRILELNKKITKLSIQIKTLKEVMDKVARELNERNAEVNNKTGEISVLLSSKQAKKQKVTIKYLLSDAGWAPSYDIISDEINKPIKLVYRGKVYNNTNIPWKNVHLKLSTADPNKSATQPELKPWYLNYGSYRVNNLTNQPGGIFSKEGYTQNMIVAELDEVTSGEEIIYKDVEVSTLSAEFSIPDPYSVPADDKPYLVDIAEYELPASYKHFAIPKLDKDAFLLARVTGWENLDLVEGPVNIYSAGTYIGQSYLNTRNVGDTLNLSLGRDPRILVTRSKLKDYSEKKVIGNKRKETHAYEIIIKNNSKTAIDIEINDQMPVSQNSEIEVSIKDISDATYDELTGKLTWSYHVKPGESKKIKLAFEIKYPKNKPLQTKSTPVMKQQMRSF